MKILVIGGAGYIGSHMVLKLHSAGYIPFVLDNLSTGHSHAVKDAALIIGDIADTKLLETLFSTHEFSAVMHFASCIEVVESIQNPLKYYQNNVANTLNLLQAMVKFKIKHLIFSSSAAVYGEPKIEKISESHSLFPLNPYGRSKRMVEQILLDIAQSNKFHYAILRYFNAAGADPLSRLAEQHEPESHLIPIVLQVAAGQRSNLHVYGQDYPTPDGTCIRDYIHVEDLCEAHLLALQALLAGKKNMTYNLGYGCGFSVLQVIKVAEQVTKHPILFQLSKRRPGDPAMLIADSTRAKKELGWQPKYNDLNIIIQHAWSAMQRLLDREEDYESKTLQKKT